MKIGIHHRENSFSQHWISYCKEKGIAYKIVNCYEDDIIQQLQDCDALMWHHHHTSFKDVFSAKLILFSMEQVGMKVFPNFNTAWFFDNKVAQKYLLESIKEASMVPSYVFYNKKTAINWVKSTAHPKVFKLKGGAGGSNVRLSANEHQSLKLINRAFGRGFSQTNRFGNLKERFRNFRNGKDNFTGLLKGIARFFVSTEFTRLSSREKGYVYFQDFIPNNSFDIRVIVINDKAFAIKRLTRKDDFRASGSGDIIHDKNAIDTKCLKIAFEVNTLLKSQCIGFDFVFDKDNNPLIIEMGYGFSISPYDDCPGYWDSHLNWYEGKFNPQYWMIENLINEVRNT